VLIYDLFKDAASSSKYAL